jgi:hypothetical protein
MHIQKEHARRTDRRPLTMISAKEEKEMQA